MTQPTYERPSGGVAQLAPADDTDTDDDNDEYHPEIVPIPEGEVTVGSGSEKRTEWDRDALKQATENGVFDGAKLIRGQAGTNPHIGMDEQPSPSDIVGHAGTFSYQDGRGPVSNGDGVILDEHLGKLVDHELLEISPDMYRELGDWDDDRADGTGAHGVKEIVACPRMTVLDRGASPNAELGPAETEALAALPEYGDLDAMDSDTQNAGSEQLGRLQYLRFWPDLVPDDDAEPLDTFDSVAAAVDDIDGVSSILGTDTDSDGVVRDAELFAVIDPDRTSLGSLNDDLRDALDDTPFEVSTDYNWVPELETEYLAAGGDDSVTDSTDSTNSDAPTGADADPSDPATATTNATAGADTDPPDQTMTEDDIDDLREQLAAAEQRADDLEDEKETLESEVDEKDDQIDTLEDEVESEREQRKDDTEHLRRRYAETATASEAAAERLVNDDDVPLVGDDDEVGLVEMANEVLEAEEEADDPEEDDEEQLSPMERYEQLSAESPSPRGGGEANAGGGAGGTPGNLSEEQLAAADDRAFAVISGNDVMHPDFEQLGAREFVKQHKGVDPAEYDTDAALRAAAERDGGEA